MTTNKKITSAAVENVLKEYFNVPPFAGAYSFHVRTGWSYEGMYLYAYDRERNWYIQEHIPPETLAEGLSFGDTYGKHILALRDKMLAHEEVYLKGYH